ncbi:MAG: PAS domain S-box protein, partial [Dehalococcoidales bacterium]|nr:PAS domain S-box protein [Dehalococcoidales bacterium]
MKEETDNPLETLWRVESTYRAVVENIPERIVIKDTNHYFISCNSLFSSFFGKTPIEVAGMHTTELYPPEVADELMKTDDIVARTGQLQTFTNTVHTETGDMFFESTKTPIKDKNGVVVGTLSVIKDVTEQKRTEESLLLWDAALKSIRECVYAMDTDFNITYWNHICEDIFGIKSSEAMGRYIGDLLKMQEDYPGQNDERVRILLEQGYNHEEQIYISPKGQIWMDVFAQAIEQTGKRYGWITLANDISERKKVEESLRLSEERFFKAFGSVPDGITIMRIEDGMFLEVNDSFCKLSGYSREEIIGNTSRNLGVWVDDRDREKLLTIIRKEGKAVNFEHKFRKKSGEQGIGLITAEPIDIAGVPCSISVVTDITEKKNAEEQLRYQASLVDNVAEAIISHDDHLKILSWNKAAESIFETKKEDIIGKDIREICRIEPVNTTIEDVIHSVTHNGYWKGESIHHLNSGKSIHMRISTMVVRDGEKKKPAFVLIMSDITEEKKAEEELKQHYQREIALRKELETEMQKRTEFSAAIVHELKTPLTAIISSSELLMETATGDTLQRLASNINRSSYELDKRTNELLDMTKGELGMLEIIPMDIDLVNLVASMHIEFNALFSKVDTSFSMELPATLPPVHADESRIRQVIYNLIDNASKYTPEKGSVTLKVINNKTEALVEVRDTGPGFTVKEKESIFEPYRQLIDGKRSKGGMGLGLAISRNLVQSHGGKMWVESRKGKG